MSRFQNLLQDIAEQADTPHDLADRALAGADRRRWTAPGALVAAAVSMAVVLVGGAAVVSWLVPDPPQVSVAAEASTDHAGTERAGTEGAGTDRAGAARAGLRVPERARPLPDGGVAPAVMAYQPDCDRPPEAGCAWRIVTVNQRHYELPTGPTGPAPDSEVTVSPSGDRLAYWRADGRVVLHDLGTGRVKEQFGWGEVRPVTGSRYAWSADGRWLLALPCESRKGPECGSNARLLDTEQQRVYGVGDGPRTVLGALSGGDRPSVLGEVHESASDIRVELDGGGEFLAYGISPGALRDGAIDGLAGSTNQDGSRLATITYPGAGDEAGDDPERNRPLLSVLDLTGQDMNERKVLTEFWVEGTAGQHVRPSPLGWQDDRHLLLEITHDTAGAGGADDTAGAGGEDQTEDRGGRRRVESLDIETGVRHLVLDLPAEVDRFALAYDRL